MSAPVFTWTPDWGCEDAHKPRVLSTSYGDSYTQRFGDGMNTDLAQIPMVFSVRTDAETLAIMTFLKTQAGVTAFQYQPYGDSTPSLWTCGDYKRRPVSLNNWTITGTFQQVVA